MFTCYICGPAWVPNQTCSRGGVHDCSTPLLQHLGDFILHAQPHPLEIDGDHALPHLFGILGGRGRTPFDPRVIMRTIQPSIRLHCPSDQRLDCCGLRHLGFDEEGLAAALLNQARGLFPALNRHVSHHDFGPFSGKGES